MTAPNSHTRNRAHHTGRHRQVVRQSTTAALVAACIAAGISLAPNAAAAPGQAGINDNTGQAGITGDGGQAGVTTPTPEPPQTPQQSSGDAGTTADWDTYIPIPTEYQNVPTRQAPTYTGPAYYDDAPSPGEQHVPEIAPGHGGPVAPIQAPEDTYRFGYLTGSRPDWLPNTEADKLNNTSAILEAQGATFFNSLGVPTTRSDRMAAAATAGAVTAGVAGATAAGVTAGAVGAAGGALIGLAAGSAIGGPVLAGPGAGTGAIIGGLALGAPAAVTVGALSAAGGALAGAAYGAGENLGEAPEPAPVPAPEPDPAVDLQPAAQFVEHVTPAAAQAVDTAATTTTGSAAIEWADNTAPAVTEAIGQPVIDQAVDAGTQTAAWVAEQPGGNQLLQAGADLCTAMPAEVGALLSTVETAAH
ncbi:hypothetical protein [Rhodococcus wratislaviensis]|uniref:Uncharacterized protein n=1 Tax=Rhodococcus wratislaviensis NBRC 100605 TaxID=1219028 RepID=X0QCE5_RHOWR|nr:hypothetical protein [Rhodococcus wratislaviensis]GAF48561.1 hypothetical protein RW1_055_00570 [Rhodococcus wratislaviensis NBRC 100605]